MGHFSQENTFLPCSPTRGYRGHVFYRYIIISIIFLNRKAVSYIMLHSLLRFAMISKIENEIIIQWKQCKQILVVTVQL